MALRPGLTTGLPLSACSFEELELDSDAEANWY
jgi:hypothetical protein